MDINTLIQRLGAEMNLPDLKLDENGVCRLLFDGKTVVDMEYEPQAKLFHLYSVLDRIPDQGREAVFEQLLAANLFTRQTAGNVLGLACEEGEILLSRALPIEKYEFEEFLELLSGFLYQAEHWAAQLAHDGMLRENPGLANLECSGITDNSMLRA